MLSQNQEETRSAAAAGLLFMAAPGPSESPAEGADEELSSKRLRLDAPRFDKENVLSPRRAIPDRQVGVLAPIASVIGQDAAGAPGPASHSLLPAVIPSVSAAAAVQAATAAAAAAAAAATATAAAAAAAVAAPMATPAPTGTPLPRFPLRQKADADGTDQTFCTLVQPLVTRLDGGAFCYLPIHPCARPTDRLACPLHAPPGTEPDPCS